MRELNQIVIHCSDTYARMDVGVNDIRKWHVKGNGWSDIGYHFVITRSGLIEIGRPIERAGAHVKGHNKHSIGICWVGGKSDDNKPEDNRTDEQKSAMTSLLIELLSSYPSIRSIVGHNDLDAGKACPCYNVKEHKGLL